MRKITIILAVFFLFISSSSIYAAVNISINSYPSSLMIGQEFSISITADNLSSGTPYYIKGRIGTASDFNKAETNNPNNSSPDDWLTDNDSWSKFPQITVSENTSTWSGTLKLRAKSNATVGQNSLRVRIKKTSTDTSYDSQVYEINLQPAPTPSSTPTPTTKPTSIPTSVPANTPVPSATSKPQTTSTKYVSPTVKITSIPSSSKDKSEGTVLGEVSNPSATPAEERSAGAEAKKSSLPVFLLFLGGGLAFIAAAILISIKKNRNN